MAGCHPGAGCRQRRATGVFSFLAPFEWTARSGLGLACFLPGDHLDGRGAFRVQGFSEARGRRDCSGVLLFGRLRPQVGSPDCQLCVGARPIDASATVTPNGGYLRLRAMDYQAHPPANGEFRPPNLPCAGTGFVRLDPPVLPSGSRNPDPIGLPPAHPGRLRCRRTEGKAACRTPVGGAGFREPAMTCATAGNLMSSRTTSGSGIRPVAPWLRPLRRRVASPSWPRAWP
jgi:hypothetical protein